MEAILELILTAIFALLLCIPYGLQIYHCHGSEFFEFSLYAAAILTLVEFGSLACTAALWKSSPRLLPIFQGIILLYATLFMHLRVLELVIALTVKVRLYRRWCIAVSSIAIASPASLQICGFIFIYNCWALGYALTIVGTGFTYLYCGLAMSFRWYLIFYWPCTTSQGSVRRNLPGILCLCGLASGLLFWRKDAFLIGQIMICSALNILVAGFVWFADRKNTTSTNRPNDTTSSPPALAHRNSSDYAIASSLTFTHLEPISPKSLAAEGIIIGHMSARSSSSATSLSSHAASCGTTSISSSPMSDISSCINLTGETEHSEDKEL